MVALYSTFMQRAVDQMIIDVALPEANVDVYKRQELLDQLSARMGKPKKKRGAGHLDRHMRLRKQLRSYHNSFLFRDGKGPDR